MTRVLTALESAIMNEPRLPTEHPEVAGLRLSGPISPRETRSYHSVTSEECSPGGSAQCDGFLPNGEECACSCHGAWDLPNTVTEVRDWHDDLNDVHRDEAGNAYQWVAR